MKKRLLQCNKYYFINFPIYPIPNIYSGLSFIQVGVEKQYLHIRIICILKKIPFIVSHLFVYLFVTDKIITKILM